MTEYTGSLQWDFSGSSLTKFQTASNGDEFTSDTFSAGPFTFHCKVYPNGRKISQKGCVMLYFVLQTSLSKINCVTVKARLYCRETLCDWKHIQHLKKDNAGIGWHSQNMLLCEVETYSHVQFVCDIDIVRIEYKLSNNVYHKLCKMNVFTKYEWDIYPSLLESFRFAHNGKFYHSVDYNNGCWCTSIAPNGANPKDIGNIKVGVQLLLLPSGISKIKTRFCISTNYENIKCDGKKEFNYGSTFVAWSDGTMKTADLKHIQRLSFVVEIVILKIYDEFNEEINKRNWFEYGIIDNDDDDDYVLNIENREISSIAEEKEEILLRPTLNNQTYSIGINANKVMIDSQKNALNVLHDKLDEIEIYKNEDEKHLITMEKTIISLQKSQHRLQQQQFEQTSMLKQYINDLSLTIQRLTNEVVFMKNKIKKIESNELKGYSPRSHSTNSTKSRSRKKKKRRRSKSSNEEKIEEKVEISSALAMWIKHDCGLPQYIAIFAENGYDNFEIVQEMERTELKEIGVKLKAHQFKIMREIKKLNQSRKHHRAKDTMDILNVARYLTPVASPAASDSNSPKEHSLYEHSKLILTNAHSHSKTHDVQPPHFLNFGAPLNLSPSRSASVSYTTSTTTNGYMQFSKHQKPMLLESPSSINNPFGGAHSHYYQSSPRANKAYHNNHYPLSLNLRPQISKMWECKQCTHSNEGTIDKCQICQNPRPR